jgi:hypothetical protein
MKYRLLMLCLSPLARQTAMDKREAVVRAIPDQRGTAALWLAVADQGKLVARQLAVTAAASAAAVLALETTWARERAVVAGLARAVEPGMAHLQRQAQAAMVTHLFGCLGDPCQFLHTLKMKAALT